MIQFSRRGLVATAISVPIGIAANRVFAADLFGEVGTPQALELALQNMERIAFNVWVGPLAPDIWVTSFTSLINRGRTWYPANGLIVRGTDGFTLVDPGWDRSSGEAILSYARERLGGTVARAIATHFHEDRVGGLGAMRRAGIPMIAGPLTAALARAHGTPDPEPLAALAAGPATVGPVELFFPGAGHTRDNITVWHEATRTLFGGCLLKSSTAGDMGNLEDGDLSAYPATLAALDGHYPDRKVTVPGHGTVAGDALARSTALVAQALSKG